MIWRVFLTVVESLSITDIDVNDDFKFIRIHYDFCQNHFACSCSRRRMVGFRFKRELEGDYINMSPSFKMGKFGDSASDSCKRNGYV